MFSFQIVDWIRRQSS